MPGEANARRVARRVAWRAQLRRFIRAVRDSDVAAVDEAVLRVSRSRRWLAPLALAVGAVVLLFEGLKLLFINWRLTLIQVLPALWIWAAMLDLKVHVLHGRPARGQSPRRDEAGARLGMQSRIDRSC